MTASGLLIQDYVDQKDRQRLLYPWHGVHILFEVAVVSLHACWNCYEWTELRQQAYQMMTDFLPRCLELMMHIGSRWKAAIRCVDRLRPLLRSVQSIYQIELEPPLGLSEARNVFQDLQDLLFPNGPLRWEGHPAQDCCEPQHDIATTALDFLDFNEVMPSDFDADWDPSTFDLPITDFPQYQLSDF